MEHLNRTLQTLSTLFDRTTQIAKNISKLYDTELDIFQVIEPHSLKQLINEELIESYHREIRLKRIIIENEVFKSRFSRESRVSVLACWIHEPYLDESLGFRIKAIIDINNNMKTNSSNNKKAK